MLHLWVFESRDHKGEPIVVSSPAELWLLLLLLSCYYDDDISRWKAGIPVCPITQGDKVGSCNDEAVAPHIVSGRLAGYVGLGKTVSVSFFVDFFYHHHDYHHYVGLLVYFHLKGSASKSRGKSAKWHNLCRYINWDKNIRLLRVGFGEKWILCKVERS